MLIDQEGGIENKEEDSEKEEVNQIEEVVVFMFVSSNNPHLSTLSFKDKISNKEIYALLESDSTSSYFARC
jgi:hypothetical protein